MSVDPSSGVVTWRVPADAKGVYPYRELFTLLKGVGYDRYTLIEIGRTYEVAEGTQYLKDYKKLWDELTQG